MVISSREEPMVETSRSSRLVDPVLERLHARRVTLVTVAMSPSSGRLLSQSQNKISANKLNWLLDVVKSCETLDIVKSRLVDLVDSGVASTDAKATVSRSIDTDMIREAERARWASGVIGRFRSVGDMRTEALAELARLERVEAAEMLSPSAESRIMPQSSLARSGSQLVLQPRSYAEFKHRVTTADWVASADLGASPFLVAGLSTKFVSRVSTAASHRVGRSEVARRSPSVSPRSRFTPDASEAVFRIGQMSPVSQD